MPLVKKVISGGQVGADMAGLKAARSLNIATGGWMPKGFRNKTGRHPSMRRTYNMREHSDGTYPPRTLANVNDSDGTIRLAVSFKTRGEQLTLKCCQTMHKPYIDVRIHAHIVDGHPIYRILVRPSSIRNWARANNIRTLNVAGNADPRIESVVTDFLMRVLR